MFTTTLINPNIHRFTLPYKDIFTTIYTIRTAKGVLLFDSASYDSDINHITEFLHEAGVLKEELKYVFISHNHTDHAGGLAAFIKEYPDTCIVSRCPRLCEQYKGRNFVAPQDGHVILDVLKVVTIPGHTGDAAAILDTRTKTLISGDGLQLYGIFGSGKWGANISLVGQHLEAIEKIRKMDIENILAAHEYHPLGYKYTGREEVEKALDFCKAPLEKVRQLIIADPEKTDEEICKVYNSAENLPTLGAHVVTAVRKAMEQ